MKKIALLVFGILAFSFLSAQKVNIPSNYPLAKLIDVSYMNYTSGGEMDTTIYTYSYDNLERDVVDEVFKLNKGSKTNSTLYTYTYDSGGVFKYCEESNYDKTLKQYVKSEGSLIRYDSSGKILYSNSGSFSGSTLIQNIFRYNKYNSLGKIELAVSYDSLHDSGQKHVYAYNPIGSLIADTQYYWYQKGMVWALSSLQIWIKDIKNRDSIPTRKIWDGTKWILDGGNSDSVFYDSAGNKVCDIYTDFLSTGNSTWRDSTKIFVGGWNLYHDSWNYSTSTWIPEDLEINTGTRQNYCRTDYYYNKDSGKYFTWIDISAICYDSLKQYKSITEGYWGDLDYYKAEWEYDSLSRLTNYFSQDNSNIYLQTYFYYPEYTSIEKQNSNKFSFHLFPNPSSGNYTISFPESFSGQLIVYDITGTIKMNQNFSGQDKINFDLNEPAGMYFLRVIEKNTNSVYTEKLIKY